MGAWTFIEPNLEWVLDQIGAQAAAGRAMPAAGLGVDGDRPDVEAPAAVDAFLDEALAARSPEGNAGKET